MSTMLKKAQEETMCDTEQTYYFASTETGEELDLNLYPHYTTIIVDTSSYTATVTLPNVAEAKGMTYSISIGAGTNELTIQDRDDSEGWTDIGIEDTNDRLVVQSDGIYWHTVESVEGD